MKEILKTIPWALIGAISFIVVTIIDILMLTMGLLNKIVRLTLQWLMNVLDVDETYEDLKNNNDKMNSMVNYVYKYCVDLMYPTEK